jgi:hypothetical protein
MFCSVELSATQLPVSFIIRSPVALTFINISSPATNEGIILEFVPPQL